MANLELPVLPPLLYRYRKLSANNFQQEIDAIRGKYIWCSTYKELNDPMEGFYKPSARFLKLTNFESTAQRIFDAKQTIGVCSFSDTHDNEVMWAHYAENYQGVCIGYRPRSLLKELPTEARLVRLGYGSTAPELGKHDGSAPADEAARKILSHKKASWLYEREWRILARPGPLRFNGRCIAELRLGSRISAEHKQALLAGFRKSIRIYQMTVENYQHHWRRLN